MYTQYFFEKKITTHVEARVKWLIYLINILKHKCLGISL
jgi:hypothetical protein